MTGTEGYPLRVAIIGAGPAGFYAASYLLKQKDLHIEVDLYDRLPSPYGLVRLGVAPDHEKIRNVIRVYDKTAHMDGFRFIGNVEIGKDISVDELRAHYHQIIYCTGAQEDRRLGIPGEYLEGSHSATEFVAWYNGHPNYRHLTFDLTQETVVVVGVGNVAVDVARILCRSVAELAKTDIADYALEALRTSRVRHVIMLGRRGPAQAAFSTPEVRELTKLKEATVHLSTRDATLDTLSAEDVATNPKRSTSKKLELLHTFTEKQKPRKKRLTLRFLTSPTELVDNGTGRVGKVNLVRNELFRSESGKLRPRATDEIETIETGLVFRSVGYRGVPIPGVPFKSNWGIIENDHGRVLNSEDGSTVIGEYVAGWIKRGPTGVIGSNKIDAQETVETMLEDLQAGLLLSPRFTSRNEIDTFLLERGIRAVSFAEWMQIKTEEEARGAESGRPRIKFTSVEEMLDLLAKPA